MINHFLDFFKALNMVENEWDDDTEYSYNRRESNNLLYTIDKGLYQFSIDAEDILRMNPFNSKSLVQLDSYGSAIHTIDGRPIYLFSTYGEEDMNEDRYCRKTDLGDEKWDYVNQKDDDDIVVFTACIGYKDGDGVEAKEVIEVADFVIRKGQLPDGGQIRLNNHMKGVIEHPVRLLDFGGKRAFYFYPDKKRVLFHVSDLVRQSAPDHIKRFIPFPKGIYVSLQEVT